MTGMPILCPHGMIAPDDTITCGKHDLDWSTALDEVFCSFIFFNIVLAVKYNISSESDANMNSIAIGLAYYSTSLISMPNPEFRTYVSWYNPALGLFYYIFQTVFFGIVSDGKVQLGY